MAIDIGKVGVSYLGRPDGVTEEFATYLAGNAIRLGRGSALGFYLKDGMEQTAREFLCWSGTKAEQIEELSAWIEGLPWNRVGFLTLVFNW